MPKIESADQATGIAVGFLKTYYEILQRPLSAKLDQGNWIVEVDVGPFFPKIAKVTIEAETGTILDYQVPPSPSSPPAVPSP